MNRKLTRLQAKTAARAGLSGSWIKGSVLIAVSLLLNMFCSKFVPFYAPAQPINAAQLVDMNYFEVLALFADMLIPEAITKTYIARSLVCLALFLLIIPPFAQGTKQFFIKVLQGEKPKLSVAFTWYANLGNVFGSIGLYLYIWFLSLLWAILIFALPVALILFSGLYGSLILYLAGQLLYLIGIVLFALKIVSYQPAYYLYAHTSTAGVRNAVRTSVSITRGRRAECLIFQLSFILWCIAVIVTGVVGQLFFMPYYLTANAAFTGILVSDYRKSCAEKASAAASE